MTETTSTPEGQPAIASEGLLKRFDRHVYGFEKGVVTGALLVMTFTYVFMIIHRQMVGSTVMDDLLFKMHGYASDGEVPEDIKMHITGFLSPLILGVLTYVLALLGVRTRWRSGEQDSATPEPWKRFFGQAFLVTAVLYGFMKLIGELPSQDVCLLTTVLCAIPGIFYARKNGEWGMLVGFLFASAFVGTFFVLEVEDAYPWAGHFSLVLLFYVGFMGASMATRDGRHVTIDAVRKKIPRKHLYLYNSIGTAITILMTVFLLILAYEHMREPLIEYLEFKGGGESKGYGHYIEGTELPVFMVSAPIFVAFATMVLRFSAHLIHDFSAWRRGELPPEPEVEIH
jgi:TRAP-type C4-dicarboxylate transport system permease small subunit